MRRLKGENMELCLTISEQLLPINAPGVALCIATYVRPGIRSNRPCGTKYARAEAVSTSLYLACLKPCNAQLVSTKLRLLMLFELTSRNILPGHSRMWSSSVLWLKPCLSEVASCIMDGWARGKRGDGATQAPVKRQAVLSEALLAEATLLVSKLTLKNELEIRKLQSAVFRTLTLADSLDFIVQARAATKAYTEEAKHARDNGTALPKGELHVYAWEAITRVAMETAGAPTDMRRDDTPTPLRVG